MKLMAMLCMAVASIASANAAKPAAPQISPAGALFLSNVTVTVSGVAEELRYTLDGSVPDTNSLRYAGPVQLTNSALLKVRAFANGKASDIAAEFFTLADTNVLSFTSSLPLIVIQTLGRTLPTPSNAPAWMQVINVATNSASRLTHAPEFSGHASLKPRGYTSMRYPKRSLTVETREASGVDDMKVSLLGMPADSDWVLYAPYPDRTLMRDVLAYELSNALGHYASRTRYVEVFLNDSTNRLSRAHYVGVYVLEEKVKIAPQRVAIHKLSPKHDSEAEISGGYLFKKDHLEKAGADPVVPAHSRPPVLMGRYPTEPGGFPALATGFLQPQDPAVFQNAVSIVTNTIVVTNVVNGTNVSVAPPSVTVVRSVTQILTNMVSVTNLVVSTNQIVATNFPLSTNVSVTTHTTIVTNPVVAAQTVVATNVIGTTNQIDAATTVVNTTVTHQSGWWCQ
jgi:hypothetical protein